MMQILLVFLAALSYPPISAYMMPQADEVALAKSAAPPTVSDRATIRVFTPNGYQTAVNGDNGFVCEVERGFAAPSFSPAPLRQIVYDPSVRAPICFNPEAARTYMKYQDVRTSLAMRGKSPDDISKAVMQAYASGEIPKMRMAGFAYMFSADMFLGHGVPNGGHFHPHIMVFSPNQTDRMLGSNQWGGMDPYVSDDAGTPFSVVVISVSPDMAVHLHHP
jgi:hypothetical protein